MGSADGVEVGMYFDVLDPKGEDVKDPDSGEVLGSLDRPKVRVKVTKVQERLSVASTYKTYEVNVGGSGGALSFGLSSSSIRHKTRDSQDKRENLGGS